jgi:hypothetical protein
MCPAHIRSSRGTYLSSFEYDAYSDRPCPSSLGLNLLLARISSVTSNEPTCHLPFPHRSRTNLNTLKPILYTPDDGKIRRPGALGASTISRLQTQANRSPHLLRGQVMDASSIYFTFLFVFSVQTQVWISAFAYVGHAHKQIHRAPSSQYAPQQYAHNWVR